ncbi:hypothetical protein GTO91_12410 [Heliobacterium undosum]|uniref:Lysine-specific metallo-endopeptidase domain-containing protein n=1 Tax=Heliomicrobium undosum TaxID=121734 RepID=A0A845L1V8_9FIRM|nr:M35 family metallo-endopeptidase [Heliomicrobium undosum]MZP30517.1 hypothetical protein [Heliomicrobium undosum]
MATGRFTCTLSAEKEYPLGAPILVKFVLNNETDVDYHVLAWRTPLETFRGDYLIVNKNGKPVPYDGPLVMRADPHPQHYIRVPAKGTVSTEIDLTRAYHLDEPGHYTVQINSDLLDHYAGQRLMEPKSRDTFNTHKLVSNVATFRIVAGAQPKKTEGQLQREKEPKQMFSPVQAQKANRPNPPVAPKMQGGDANKRRAVQNAHEGATTFAYACANLLKTSDYYKNKNYVTWFGAVDQTRQEKVTGNYQKIYDTLISDQFTYYLDGGDYCEPGVIAYTYKYCRSVYFCGGFYNYPFIGIFSQMGIVLHELTHAVTGTDDVVYGTGNCKNLAKNDSAKAVKNADSYRLFTETTFPFDMGFDASAVLPNGKTYVTFANLYVRYSDSSANQFDAGYPKPIRGNWGALPESFNQGFDSMVVLPNGKIYVTKGSQYVRYSDNNASKVDDGYPLPIRGHWGNLPDSFNQGFDAAVVLPNGKIYVTTGSQYVRYSDKTADTVDEGYPLSIKGHWGNLPDSFDQSFDTAVVLPNKKIYVTKGSQYVRYSDNSAGTVDGGYPLPIQGHWGKMPDA